MKSIPQILITTLAILSFSILLSCEKPVIETEKESTTTKNNDSTTSTNGDNGGWANDDGNASTGDTLNVSSFKADAENGTEVWVRGYIVGCATGSGGYQYQLAAPYEFSTAVLIADSKEETNKSNTIAIQLKSGSKIRREVNLVDHPDNIGKLLIVNGTKTTYLKIGGIKEISSYTLK